jgi:hypothetical protein
MSTADVYQDANLPVARRRLYQGGVRLARVLNEAFAENPGGEGSRGRP